MNDTRRAGAFQGVDSPQAADLGTGKYFDQVGPRLRQRDELRSLPLRQNMITILSSNTITAIPAKSGLAAATVRHGAGANRQFSPRLPQ